MIRRSRPISRSTKEIGRRIAVKAKRVKARRVSVLRDRSYLDWLKERTCVACFLVEKLIGARQVHVDRYVDPAHGPVNGAASKGPDNEAVPLCRHHHDEQHRIGWTAFEAKYGVSREKEAVAHYAAYLISKEHNAT